MDGWNTIPGMNGTYRQRLVPGKSLLGAQTSHQIVEDFATRFVRLIGVGDQQPEVLDQLLVLVPLLLPLARLLAAAGIVHEIASGGRDGLFGRFVEEELAQTLDGQDVPGAFVRFDQIGQPRFRLGSSLSTRFDWIGSDLMEIVNFFGDWITCEGFPRGNPADGYGTVNGPAGVFRSKCGVVR